MFRIAVLGIAMFFCGPLWSSDYFVYAGTYTNQKSKGIYAWRFNPETGRLTAQGLVAETRDPSYLALHPNGRFLYAVNEVDDYQGTRSGSVSAFSVDRATGGLTLLNTVSSRGAGPCHLSLDKSGKVLLVANYTGGSVAAFPVAPDGRLGESSAFFQHSGMVALPERQGGPHAHAALVSPDSRFALVTDLGLDQVLVYRLNVARASLDLNNLPFAKVNPGAGPRHLAFSPTGKVVYVNNEIQSSVTSFEYDAVNGLLREVGTVSTLPKDYQGANNTAEIVVSASGKFVYVSNRGQDSVVVFAADSTGKLNAIQHEPTQGKTPRNFAIDPTGRYLFAANQNSDSIVLFRIDPKSGKLTPAGVLVEAPTPVCIVFVKVK